MAQTVSTATSAEVDALAAEVLKRVDWRPLGDLCSDTGTRLASASVVQANANFLALVRDAYADIESACFVGGRYNKTDLTALLADTGAGAGKLYRILSWRVVVLAYERRPDLEMKQPEIERKAAEHLQLLRDGERVFAFEESMEAGRAEATTETTQDVEDRGGTVYEMRRLFGRRVNRRGD